MADMARLPVAPDSDGDAESGEDLDDDQEASAVDGDAGVSPAAGTSQKRKRGKVWQSVAVEEELVKTLSKVSTDETPKLSTFPFVDLDDPSVDPFLPSPAVARIFQNLPRAVVGDYARPGGRRSIAGTLRTRGGAQVKASRSGDGEIGAGDQGEASTSECNMSANTSGKRKNVMIPKAKRRSKAEDKNFFSVYPDLNDEIQDEDSLHIAARKAVHQLGERWNPWTITQIVSHLGNAEARKLLQLTKTIEQNGGMLTKDTLTRRTPGGVFITLFKADAEKKYGKDTVKEILAPQPGAPPKPSAKAKHERALAKRAHRRAEAAKKKSEAEHPMDGLAESVHCTAVQPSTLEVVGETSMSMDDEIKTPPLSDMPVGDVLVTQDQCMDESVEGVRPAPLADADKLEEGELPNMIDEKTAVVLEEELNTSLVEVRDQSMDVATENVHCISSGGNINEMVDETTSSSLAVNPDSNMMVSDTDLSSVE